MEWMERHTRADKALYNFDRLKRQYEEQQRLLLGNQTGVDRGLEHSWFSRFSQWFRKSLGTTGDNNSNSTGSLNQHSKAENTSVSSPHDWTIHQQALQIEPPDPKELYRFLNERHPYDIGVFRNFEQVCCCTCSGEYNEPR